MLRNTLFLCPMGYVFLGALVSWGSVHANLRAYVPLGSTRCAPDYSWALEAVGRAASVPSGAGRDRTGENVGLSPRRVKSPKPRDGGRSLAYVGMVSPSNPHRPWRGGGGGALLGTVISFLFYVWFFVFALSPEGGLGSRR